jgi:hypothetical protein
MEYLLYERISVEQVELIDRCCTFTASDFQNPSLATLKITKKYRLPERKYSNEISFGSDNLVLDSKRICVIVISLFMCLKPENLSSNVLFSLLLNLTYVRAWLKDVKGRDPLED